MSIVVTGISKLTNAEAERIINKFITGIKPIRIVNALEQLTIAAVGSVLDNAGVAFPVGTSSIGIYIEIDDAIEDIKDEYFNNILNEGTMGVSPLLFPYTSPNALAAQVSIAFDIRGESITMPINHSCSNVIEYAAECVAGKYISSAIAGRIILNDRSSAVEGGKYVAEFFLLEKLDIAVKRGAKIYRHLKAETHENF